MTNLMITVSGVGYKLYIEKTMLILFLGFSHSIKVQIPINLEVSLQDQQTLIIFGPKQFVGEFANILRTLKKPEPYKGKGIFLHFKKNITILNNFRKTGKK